jgi:hypothetical protein
MTSRDLQSTRVRMGDHPIASDTGIEEGIRGDAPRSSDGRKRKDGLLRAGILDGPRIERAAENLWPVLECFSCGSGRENGGGPVQEASAAAVAGGPKSG